MRNTLKYVVDKDRKAFANDLKTIYIAPSEQTGREALDDVMEKWEEKYPRAMKRWYDNWDAVSPIFKFSKDVRMVIYTTNAIESLNATYRRLERPAQRIICRNGMDGARKCPDRDIRRQRIKRPARPQKN